jgi:hypothetical protein
MRARFILWVFFCSLVSVCQMGAQAGAPGMLSADEVKHLAPGTYFFRGQSASVQLRNTVGFRADEGRLVLAGLVDTGGYSSDVKAKYQGFLITEVKLSVEGKELPPGQYGFGFSSEGKFVVMDVGANDVGSVESHKDAALPRARPLVLTEQTGGGYRLYEGRQWIALKPE